MPFKDLLQYVHKTYAPAIALRRVLTHERRALIEQNLVVICLILFVFALLSFAVQQGTLAIIPGSEVLGILATKVWGAFLVAISLAYLFTALEAMHRSQYYHGLQQVIGELSDPKNVPVSWEVASVVVDTPLHDITGGFLDSSFGQEILYRAGIEESEYVEFYTNRTPTVTADTFVVERDAGVVLSTYAISLCKNDKVFVQFLNNNNVSVEQFVEAARWVTRIERSKRRRARWWSRDNLGRIQGIAKTWGYGETYLLETYGHDMTHDHVWSTAAITRHREDDEVEAIEAILARARHSNALVVSDNVTGVRQKVAQLYYKIRKGEALPPVDAKRIFMLDLELLVAEHSDKAGFETVLRSLLDQAVTAGNIILYIEYFTVDVASIKTLGVDLVDMLLPYFDEGDVQIIAVASRDGFYNRLQKDSRLMRTVDTVHMHDLSQGALMSVLEQRAFELERGSNVVVSVPALESVAQVADQYFPTGVMPDKAFDLLEELIPIAVNKHISLLKGHDVQSHVTQKTGIPVGEPTAQERQKLLSLETLLHRRIVGQDKAVSAVARALRRARSGISGNARPMGSFLFLGPTGVGKTETAKALAHALFDDEDAMARLDMSEFTGADAAERLIGSFETGTPGVLATLVREKPYGVLLLDEFEKADKHVHDLFLQILDEGHFTDVSGKLVNARNLIVIATSNAAAELLWKWEKQAQDVTQMKATLVDALVEQGLYRPEMLNRFDDIVVFHALSPEHVYTLAERQLEMLRTRVSDELKVDIRFDQTLITTVARLGYDPKFGGRPMRRIITQNVEQIIADKVLEGDIQPGAHVTIYGKDIEEHVATR